MRRAALSLVLLLPALAQAAAPASGYTSCRQRTQAPAIDPGAAAPAPASPAMLTGDQQEAVALDQAVKRFDEEGRSYRSEVQTVVKKQLEERRRFLADHYDQALRNLELLQRGERDSAIARFQEFLSRYPDDPQFTPDAMFRLAELYYEKSSEDFNQAFEDYKKEQDRLARSGGEMPAEPVKSYAPSIALYQRLITGFPEYRYTHGVYYLLAYCLGEMGQGQEAQIAFQELIQRYPDSPFVPEAWLRMGNWHFDEVQADSLQRAAEAFSKMYAYPSHPLFDKAIYKLGWTYYRMDDFQNAVEAFTRLLDFYVAQATAPGEKPSGDIWPEAIQYTAISFSDEKWGGVQKAKAFYAALGGRAFEAEVFERLGEVYFEETRFAQAVEAYREVLALAPNAPSAPMIQERIVRAWSADRQFDLEARERQALVVAFSEGTPWWEANKGDPDLMAQVRDLFERSLLRAAAFHHAQAQQYKNEGKLEAAVSEYRVAAGAYGDYLVRFPHSKQAYELQYNHADCLYNALEFEQAARTYALVRDDPADDKYRAEAALSAVISWQGEVERQERSGLLPARRVLRASERPAGEAIKLEPLPEVYQNLIRDSDIFVATRSSHEKAAATAYKAGEAFYKYDDFEEARCRFEEVVARWPDADPPAVEAAKLVIESYLVSKDWRLVEEGASRMQGLDVAKNAELKSELQKFKLGGRFNRAVQAMEAKQFEDGARLFIALVSEDPRHEFADKALFNAALCYEEARRFESALRMYERLSAEYPSSTLADEALFRVGFNAENTYDFEKAVERYNLLVEKYPGSKHRKDALYNAARAQENLQRYEPAAAAFARYAKAYPDADDAARTQYHAALIYEKTKDWKREVAALQDFNRRFGKSKEHVLLVQSQLKIALAHHELKDEKAARAGYAATVAEFAARGLNGEKAANAPAAAAAAEATFRLAEVEFEKYDAITLPSAPAKLLKAIDVKLKEAARVAPLYDAVQKYRRPDWILAAAYRKAFVLERLVQAIVDVPPPPEYLRPENEDVLAKYQDTLNDRFARPAEEGAVKIYIDAIESARKLHVKNEWTKKIAESLARYRPAEYPVLKEAKASMVSEDVSPAPFVESPEGPVRKAPAPPKAEPAEGEPPADQAAPPAPGGAAGAPPPPVAGPTAGAVPPAPPAAAEKLGGGADK